MTFTIITYEGEKRVDERGCRICNYVEMTEKEIEEKRFSKYGKYEYIYNKTEGDKIFLTERYIPYN